MRVGIEIKKGSESGENKSLMNAVQDQKAVDSSGCAFLVDIGVIAGALLSPASSVSIALSTASPALGLSAIVSSINVGWR